MVLAFWTWVPGREDQPSEGLQPRRQDGAQRAEPSEEGHRGEQRDPRRWVALLSGQEASERHTKDTPEPEG